MAHSLSEENYLKAIYKLSERSPDPISTSSLAKVLDMKAASVTDMLQKLADKKLIRYRKYQGVLLTEGGKRVAVTIIRKHRLWELFLVTKLGFPWDEVHEVAEELEHIQSDKLVRHLDEFLGKPKFDPHGDPIPDERGNFSLEKNYPLSEAPHQSTVTIAGVIDHRPSFLQYLNRIGLLPGKKVKVKETTEYDKSMSITLVETRSTLYISHVVANNILVR